MTSTAPSDLLPREAQDEVRLRVDPPGPGSLTDPPGRIPLGRIPGPGSLTDPPGRIPPGRILDPPGRTGPGSLVAPHGGDQALAAEGHTSLAPCGPATRRTASADPDVSLGLLGWLAVLLIAVLLTVLAHAANVRAGSGEHREPSLLADPAYVVAESAEYE